MLRNKLENRQRDEALKPLAAYRVEELNRLSVNFFGLDPAYHDARRRFVFKEKPPLREIRRADIGRMPDQFKGAARGTAASFGTLSHAKKEG